MYWSRSFTPPHTPPSHQGKRRIHSAMDEFGGGLLADSPQKFVLNDFESLIVKRHALDDIIFQALRGLDAKLRALL